MRTTPARSTNRPRRAARRSRRPVGAVAVVAAAALLAGACSGDDEASTVAGGEELSVELAEPGDGDEVGTTFDVSVDTSVPIGEPDTGRHHVHLYYDGNTGEGDYDLVYEPTFTVDRLEAGEHTIEAVVANADHSLTDARDEITVTVGEGGGEPGMDDDGDVDTGY